MKLSRLGQRNVSPLCSLMSRNASHFTYVPDAPMENMGKSFFSKSQNYYVFIFNFYTLLIIFASIKGLL